MLLEARLRELAERYLAADSHLISEQAFMEAMAPLNPREIKLAGDEGKKSGSVEFVVDAPGIVATNQRIWEQIQGFLAHHPRHYYYPPPEFYFKENGTLSIQLKNLDKWGISPNPEYGFSLGFDPNLMIPVRDDCTTMCWRAKSVIPTNSSEEGRMWHDYKGTWVFASSDNNSEYVSITGKFCPNDRSVASMKFQIETHRIKIFNTAEIGRFFKHMGYNNGTQGLFQR